MKKRIVTLQNDVRRYRFDAYVPTLRLSILFIDHLDDEGKIDSKMDKREI